MAADQSQQLNSIHHELIKITQAWARRPSCRLRWCQERNAYVSMNCERRSDMFSAIRPLPTTLGESVRGCALTAAQGKRQASLNNLA